MAASAVPRAGLPAPAMQPPLPCCVWLCVAPRAALPAVSSTSLRGDEGSGGGRLQARRACSVWGCDLLLQTPCHL